MICGPSHSAPWDQIGQVGKVGPAPAIGEEVVGRSQRREIASGLAQRHLYRTHVEVRGMVGCHDEMRVLGDMAMPAHLGLQRPRVEKFLCGRQAALAQTLQGSRQPDVTFLVVLESVASARLALFQGRVVPLARGQS